MSTPHAIEVLRANLRRTREASLRERISAAISYLEKLYGGQQEPDDDRRDLRKRRVRPRRRHAPLRRAGPKGP
jgi:signal transduction histidine kinase